MEGKKEENSDRWSALLGIGEDCMDDVEVGKTK